MTDRPGAVLLVTPNPEELRGAPGPAREAAFAAAERDPSHRAVHLLDAAFASIAAGEPREAAAILDRIDDPADDLIARRIDVCRSWAAQIDANLYPGWAGAELRSEAAATPTIGVATSADPETLMLEAYAADAPVPLYSLRNTLESMVRMAPGMAAQVLPAAIGNLEELLQIAAGVGLPSTALWALVAQADLAHRCGHLDDADAALLRARQGFVELGDPIGVIHTFLTEGDWYATPGAYPETLGLDLGVQNFPSRLASEQDLDRAAYAYGQAESLLAEAGAPLAAAATRLRQATVAWLRGEYVTQLALLRQAGQASADAGDLAGRHLATVHTLLARIAAGDGPLVRAEAGSGWGLRPRGPIDDIVTWAKERGSVTWCTGLGRLCQRAGEAWERMERLDNAESAYLLGVSMLPASGAVSPSSALSGLISLDERTNPSRAIVRLDRALAVTPSDPDPLRWMERTELLMSLTKVQIDRAGSSQMGRLLPSMERTIRLMSEHLAVAGAPPESYEPLRPGDGEEALTRMLADTMSSSVDDLLVDDGSDETPSLALQTGARAFASQVRMMRMQLALTSAQTALNGGWEAQADVLFQQALDECEGAEAAAPWMPALILAAWGKYDEAQAQIEDLRGTGALAGPVLGALALRSRDYETAREILTGIQAESWLDLLDQAEIALESGAPDEASALATEAMARYERLADEMDRDPDLIAFVDDVSAAFLYLIAARAGLAMVDARRVDGDEDAARMLRLRALADSDRGRALSMRNLASGLGADAAMHRWRQAGSEWSAAFLRMVEAIDADTPIADEAVDELDAAERALVMAEADLHSSRSVAQPAYDVEDVELLQSGLPDGTCVIAYLAVGTELLTFGLTANDLIADRTRVSRGLVSGLVQRFVEACSRKDPGAESAELAELLFEPVAAMMRANRRLIIVPHGPLSALPFHVLPFGGGLLVDSHNVSYARSVSSLRMSAVDRAMDISHAVVVGDPEFDRAAHPDLQNLPGADVEAAVAARHLGTDVLLSGEDASEAALRKALSGCDVLHVSAHGTLHEAAPPLSSIVLAGRDELTLADLMGMEIGAGLVVLSACDSGGGTATLGGDLVGLTRGLMAAGVERSIVSLWPVDDVTSCVTMALFYEDLARGVPPAMALADAQRTVRAMTIADIDDAYEQLGGSRDPSGRRLRRGHMTRPASASLHALELDPEFLEVDEPDDYVGDQRAPAALWAPFILVGV